MPHCRRRHDENTEKRRVDSKRQIETHGVTPSHDCKEMFALCGTLRKRDQVNVTAGFQTKTIASITSKGTTPPRKKNYAALGPTHDKNWEGQDGEALRRRTVAGPANLEVPDEPSAGRGPWKRALPTTGDCSRAQHTVFGAGGQSKD